MVGTARLRRASALLLLAACTSGGHQSSPSATVGTTAPVAVATGSARCTTSQLEIAPGRTGAGLGHSGTPILFRNRGTAPCHLRGYPGVAGLDAAGNQVVQAARSLQGYLGGLRSGDSPPLVELAPGETASALVEGTNNPEGTATSCPSYPSLLVTPPDDTQSVRVTAGLSGCSLIQVHPVVPGTTGTVPG